MCEGIKKQHSTLAAAFRHTFEAIKKKKEGRKKEKATFRMCVYA